jgi:hypothetical protein
MFNLEEKIVEWRNQMLAAGIQTPVPLEELEIHLREEIEQHSKSGLNDREAFEISVQQIGRAGTLKIEFAKVGENLFERLKHFLCVLAGVPNHQLAANMNIPNQNIEPRWATYFKAFALAFPGIFIWLGSMIFVIPKLKAICAVAGTKLPMPVFAAFVVSDFSRHNFILGAVMILAALIWLEWRSRRWPRYRRLIFGVTAFSLNLTALIMVTIMMVFAVIVAANLLHAK